MVGGGGVENGVMPPDRLEDFVDGGNKKHSLFTCPGPPNEPTCPGLLNDSVLACVGGTSGVRRMMGAELALLMSAIKLLIRNFNASTNPLRQFCGRSAFSPPTVNDAAVENWLFVGMRGMRG